MAITHEDISHRRAQVGRPQHGGGAAMIGSRLAVILVGVSIVCALITFVLCLAGEASRSEVFGFFNFVIQYLRLICGFSMYRAILSSASITLVSYDINFKMY